MNKREIDTEGIKKIIPHREPFIMIDRVRLGDDGKSVIGYKHLSGQEDFLKGHFPGKPIMPGVLLVETMAQTACVLFLSRPDLANALPYFMTIEKVKFRKPVLPGDTVETRVKVLHVRSRAGKVRAEAYVNNVIVAESEFMFMLVNK